jgi:AraC-like DNA-binding protein
MNLGDSPETDAERLIRKLDIKVLESRRMVLGDEWHLDLSSSFWRFYVNNRSGAWLISKGEKLSLSGGEFWLVPAWVRFQTGTSRPVQQDYLHFNVRGLPPVFFKRVFDRPLQLRPSPALKVLCARWQREGSDFPGLCWAATLAHAAFAAALSDWQAGGRRCQVSWTEQSEAIRRVLDVLDLRIKEPPSNAELARIFGSSEDHFVRQFRRATTLTPASYGRGRRVAVAAEWLAMSERSIEEIAEKTGFTDRFHFSRVFKSRFGQSPAAYRRMHRLEFDTLGSQMMSMQSP